MKNLIKFLFLIPFAINAQAQEKETQSLVLDTYKTTYEFSKDSASIECIYEVNTITEDYIHIKKKLNTETKEKDKNKYCGFKYNDKKYYNLLRSESSNPRLYVPVHLEGFFSLVLMPKGKVNTYMPSRYSGGVLTAALTKNQIQNVWLDKDGKEFYIMIFEPNIKGTACYAYSSLADREAFGVYMGKASIKRYNNKFGFNLDKKTTKVEDWIEVVNHLNKLHAEGNLDYSLKQIEALKRKKERLEEQEARNKIKPYAEKNKNDYVPYSQRSNN